jgi:predicted nucleotidyltransferase
MKSLADIPLRDNERQSIEAAARLLRETFLVEQVILFGSKARGTSDEESDIDLLLLTPRRLDWREKKAITTALFKLELAYDVVISTLIVSTEDWTTGLYQVLPIHDEIQRDGVAA